MPLTMRIFGLPHAGVLKKRRKNCKTFDTRIARNADAGIASAAPQRRIDCPDESGGL